MFEAVMGKTVEQRLTRYAIIGLAGFFLYAGIVFYLGLQYGEIRAGHTVELESIIWKMDIFDDSKADVMTSFRAERAVELRPLRWWIGIYAFRAFMSIILVFYASCKAGEVKGVDPAWD